MTGNAIASGIYPLGLTTVTQTAADGTNNLATCQSTVSVVDTTAPTLSCPADVVLECNADGQRLAVDTGHATATDLCTSATVTDPAISAWAVGTNPATHSAVDEAGNTITCTNLVTVRDTTAPTAVCPADVVAECNALGQAIGVSAGVTTATDVCSTPTVTDPALASYPLGATTVNHVVVDAAGNDASCSNTVTVRDTTSPTVSCPADQTIECNAPDGATGVDVADAASTDVCSNPTVTNDKAATGSYAFGATTVTQIATDGTGNLSSCASTVTVVDTTDPALACPADLTVECNAQGGANGIAAGVATATDVCGGATVTSDAPAGGNYLLGETLTNHTAVDTHGNDTTCTSKVTVVDTTGPTVSCPADVTVECNAQGGATGVDAGHATATDVCSAVTVTDPAVGTYALGANPASHTVIDTYGNQTTCNNVVRVVDTTAPVFDAGSLTARTVTGTCGAAPVSFVLPTATDGCQAVTVTCSPVPGNSVGVNTSTCTATDGSGNQTTATVTVKVLAPYRTAISSLADDNVADDPATDADVSNLFKSGTNLPHYVKVYNCAGADVTGTAHLRLTVRLTVTRRTSGVGAAGDVAIVPELAGNPDAGNVMAYSSGYFRYSLATNTSDYPVGTVNNATYFNTLVVATENANPGVWVGREDARLETNTK